MKIIWNQYKIYDFYNIFIGPMGAWAKDPVPGAAGARNSARGRAPAALGTGSFTHEPYANIMKIIYVVWISYYFHVYFAWFSYFLGVLYVCVVNTLMILQYRSCTVGKLRSRLMQAGYAGEASLCLLLGVCTVSVEVSQLLPSWIQGFVFFVLWIYEIDLGVTTQCLN